jgi:predicted dehydrogenase
VKSIEPSEGEAMTYKMIQVGTGGHGRNWCQRFIPPNVEDGLVEVVAAVDINAQALQNARDYLGLRPDQCYTDIWKALDENPADFCSIVVPPAAHEQVVDAALAHDLHILSEKPIADTLPASIRIAAKVARARKKMAVTMSHRFDQDKTTLRRAVKSGDYGPLDYLVCRVTCDNRKFGSWGEYRHRMQDPLLIEAAAHRLDILADLAGARCDVIYARTWNPPWGEYAGDSQALAILSFENGVQAVYESAKTNAVSLNGPGREYIRAECEGATLTLNSRRIERFVYDPSQKNRRASEGQGEEVPLLEQPKWTNAWLIEQFVQWLDGGDQMATNVWDNLQAVAMTWAAIQSSRTGQPLRVQELLHAAQQEVTLA